MATDIPEFLQPIAEEYPEVWQAYCRLGQASREAGPLDEKTVRLVKLALAIAASREGATHSQTRRALAAGCSPEGLEHVALLAVNTIGWSGAMAGLSWIRDVTHAE